MINQIAYPLEAKDIVVIGRLSSRSRTLTVRPDLSGAYTLFIWPRFFPDERWIVRHEMMFDNQAAPPQRVVFDLDQQRRLRSFLEWEWSLVRKDTLKQSLSAAEALFSDAPVMKGYMTFEAEGQRPSEVRTVVWSCHQPFMDEGEVLALDPHTKPIMTWYQSLIDQFVPHAIWGFGDNAYSDGTPAGDFPDQVYNDEGWQHYEDNVRQLAYAYSRMYRYHWSFDEFRHVLASYPHIMMWDDHEIRDGWGSEADDFQPGNVAMFHVAHEVAQQYVLNVGPRVRQEGEAHKASIDGSQAMFLMDNRTERHYQDPGGRLFSDQQLEDLYQFIERVIDDHQVKYFLLGTAVPFLYISESFENLLSKAPQVLTDLAMGIRDDIRDSWSSPGNQEALKQVLSALRHLQLHRPDLHVVNISGDIHVTNAFELLPPGFVRPMYQITTSAITNRSHMPDLVAAVAGIGDFAYSAELGLIRRLWPDMTDPNVLCITATAERLVLDLKILPVDDSKNVDKQLILS